MDDANIKRFFKEFRHHDLTCIDDDLYEAGGEGPKGGWIEARGDTPQEAIQWVVHYLDNPIEYEDFISKNFGPSGCDPTF